MEETLSPETQEAAPVEEPRRSSRWPLRLSLAYLALVCLAGLLGRLLAERFWWSTMLVYVPQVFYLVPVLVNGSMALLWKDARALAVNGIAIILVLGPLMGWNIPLPRFAPPASAPRVRVLAYNIKGGVEGFGSISKQVDRYAPDVVVFSEATGWSDDSVILQQLARRFEGWNRVHAGEMFIASRWPVVEEEKLALGPDDVKYQSGQRQALRLAVQAPFGRFHVVGAHFYTSMHGWTLRKEWRRLPQYLNETARARRLQTEELTAWTRNIQDPLIVAGDFNTPPAGHIYGHLAGQFKDAFREAGSGWGHTYPSRRPLLRIDYIFSTRHWSVTRCETGPPAGSDHRPVFAELALR